MVRQGSTGVTRLDEVLTNARSQLLKAASPTWDGAFDHLVDEIADPRNRFRFSKLRHQLGLDRVVAVDDVPRLVKSIMTRGNGFAKVQSTLDKMLRQAQPQIIASRLDAIRDQARRDFVTGVTCAHDTKTLLNVADAIERRLHGKGDPR